MPGRSSEPRIEVNGVRLTHAQAMTVRVAIEAFAASLATEGLGDDATGRALKRVYLDRLKEIREIVLRAIND